ncbi:NAD-dependent epimerase/dehydratase family protein [Demequina phytophila]|uniref:NAD-dependent epimerase/dehydratase family protein n=1 Tax=Demequina phytophila TaxID=1638981 RepID=UPI00078205C1|nr:NAD-dependent epimerase/dehydratase family protein [Demequina phytophila]
MTRHVVLGTGAVGAALVRRLVSDGHEVTAVNRSGSRGRLPDAAALRAGDVTDRAFLDSVVAGAAVVHQVTQPAYHRWEAEFPALQRAVLGAASRAGAAVVLADNLYAYGPPDGVIDAATPERPTTRKGRVRAAMAAEALAAHRAGRVRVALSRPSNYVGDGYAVMEELVFGPARAARVMRFLGRLDVPHSWSAPADAARTMAAIAEAGAWGRAWIAPTLEPVTARELARRVWAAAGRSGDPKVQGLRGMPMRVLGVADRRLRESAEMMYEFDEPFVVDASATEAALGVRASAWDEVIARSLVRAH